MIIGEALKQERNHLGLTQNEMIQGIIHKSHYSKVERGIEGISADSLFKILFAHHIDVDNFLGLIKNEYISKDEKKAEELEHRIMVAFNNSDKNEIEKCLQEVLKLPGNKILKYRIVVAVAAFRDQLDELSIDIKENIVDEFTKHDTWLDSIDALRLFANCMPVFSEEQLNNCIQQVLKRYSTNNTSEPMTERIAIICNNYLYYCYYYTHINNKNVENCLYYLKKLDNRSHFMFYRIAGLFFKYMFEGNKKKAKQIRAQLVNWGYGSRVSSWKI
ncbi:helix-turn-helix transcriptional regulator [uncultured Lactobacillus sp.]|uniref:helix-turn-helix domain-containing protein n=1 Tax=uncultured Lactobacillus sp. TaxID=153152 RepID=UPI00259B0CB9|nr:helix-turn-helix transcriptional regulator [uncultured Lactobacillus sp.]